MISLQRGSTNDQQTWIHFEQKYEQTKDENTADNKIIDIKDDYRANSVNDIEGITIDHQEDNSIRHMHNKFRRLILVQNQQSI